VRAGEAASAQAVGAQQGVDHGCGTALAVGTGEVDDRVTVLRVAEQFGQCADPPEARRHAMLRPACRQRGNDLGVGLIGRHGDPSLGSKWGRLLELNTPARI
jgi:hypothetical protein